MSAAELLDHVEGYLLEHHEDPDAFEALLRDPEGEATRRAEQERAAGVDALLLFGEVELEDGTVLEPPSEHVVRRGTP